MVGPEVFYILASPLYISLPPAPPRRVRTQTDAVGASTHVICLKFATKKTKGKKPFRSSLFMFNADKVVNPEAADVFPFC